MQILPVKEKHKRALFKIHEICFRQHIEKIWGWTDDWQWDNFCSEWEQYEWRVLLDGDTPIGALCWHIEADHLYLKKISLVPEYQNQGLGKKAMAFIQGEASKNDNPIKLSVFKTNPRVISFYESLGFKITEEVETGFRMSKGFTK